MSASAAVSVDRHAGYNKGRIFLVSVLALFTAGVAASLRADVASDLQRIFFDPIDKAHSAEMIGAVLGVPFLGFAFTIAIGSPLLDLIGAALLLPMSGVCFILGTLTILFASSIASGAGVYNVIWIGAVITGIGWGLVETVINPLTATMYSDEKTARLNALHAWWPGGLIAGGLLGYGLSQAGVDWKIKLAIILLPAALVVIMCIGMKFPPTERAASGISMGEMFKELLKPMFLLLFCSMFLTAASELAPGQWVDLALTRTVHMQGILLLVYVSGIMFVARHFAGPLAHKLSPIGLLWFSCLLASLGLVSLSFANSPVMGILAATVWGCGVCFMWPTMLATSSERFPRGGALLMGLMGTAGTLSSNFVLPVMGKIYDNKKIELAGGDAAFQALSGDRLNDILGQAAQTSFRAVAILPAILLIVFGAIWLHDRSRGGFKAVKL
ncbi:MAG TPA: MFS transporter [Bryobacteraceae bacterium]|nr:MFS transporter [Bryobacteraceae bacterium]